MEKLMDIDQGGLDWGMSNIFGIQLIKYIDLAPYWKSVHSWGTNTEVCPNTFLAYFYYKQKNNGEDVFSYITIILLFFNIYF